MSMVGERAAVQQGNAPYIYWSAVIAGAVAAAAASFVLLSFGSAIGLAVLSGANTWRGASVALAVLSGVWLLVVAIGANALGGYIAGRMRPQWSVVHDDEVEFRDGTHGLIVWALGLLIGTILALAAAAPLASTAARIAASPTNTGEAAALAPELDRLFRSDRRADNVDLSQERAEAGRLLTALTGRDPVAEDRAHLTRMVSTRTGLAQPDAERRVDGTIARVRDAATKARRMAILLSFMTAAAIAVGAATAWFAAGLGGRHRDTANPPSLGVRRVRVMVSETR